MPTPRLNIFGTFTGTGVTDPTQSNRAEDGRFNASISGTYVATVELQWQFDKDTIWRTIEAITGTGVPADDVFAKTGFNAGRNVQYRFEVTAFTSGTISVKANQ